MEKILMIGVGARNLTTDERRIIYLPLSDISHVEKYDDKTYLVFFRDDCYARKYFEINEVMIASENIQTILSVR